MVSRQAATPSASTTNTPRPSVGPKGDSYDCVNALAEIVNGLYKTELIHHQGPWRAFEQVELATPPWVSGWNETAPPRGL